MRFSTMLAGVLVGMAAVVPPAGAQPAQSPVSVADLDALGRAAVLNVFPNPNREGRRVALAPVTATPDVPTPFLKPPASHTAAVPVKPTVPSPAPVHGTAQGAAKPLARTPTVTAAKPPLPTVKPAPAKPQPVKTEPVKTEPPKVEPVKTEPPKVEPAKPVPPADGGVIRVGPPVAERAGNEPAKPEPMTAEPAKMEPAKVEPVKVEPVKVEPVVAAVPTPPEPPAVSGGTSSPPAVPATTNWRDVARQNHRYVIEGLPDLFNRLNANPTQKRFFDLTQVNFIDTIALSGKKIAGSQLVGDWYCRSIKVMRDAAFGFPYFNCRVSKREGRLYFEKTTGTQRRAGWLFEDDGKRWVFLGALAYGEDAPGAYSGLPGGGDSAMDVVGAVVAGNGGQFLAIFPEADSYELYELVK